MSVDQKKEHIFSRATEMHLAEEDKKVLAYLDEAATKEIRGKIYLHGHTTDDCYPWNYNVYNVITEALNKCNNEHDMVIEIDLDTMKADDLDLNKLLYSKA